MHYDLYPPIIRELISFLTSSAPTLTLCWVHSSKYTPASLKPRGTPDQAGLFMGTAFVEIIKERKACEFPGRSAAAFCVISVSLISAAARQTLRRVFHCPRLSSARVSAPGPARWGTGERETINLPGCTCQR